LVQEVSIALQPEDQVGTVRENFFVNQVAGAGYIIRAVRKGDFLIDDKYLFEIGGRSRNLIENFL